MVSITLNILPHRTFCLCGTIINDRESGKSKKLGLMQDPVSNKWRTNIIGLEKREFNRNPHQETWVVECSF